MFKDGVINIQAGLLSERLDSLAISSIVAELIRF
jgi:hypothetical protein